MSNTDEKIGSAPSHFIGIGASAGGLEALQEFLSHLDNDTGAALVIVQHLSPDYKSMMPELLAKYTKMPIHQAADGMALESNSIYLMPARVNMLIAEGKLMISNQMPDNQLHLPIDVFLRSLAQDQQHRAIGVVLSGTGSDGTRGIKSLNECGGLVIVQDPKSAKFDGMPKSAYNTGLADMLLRPNEMGASILNYIRHPVISRKTPVLRNAVEGDDQTLKEIFELLKAQSSINFSQYKAATVARRIERRLGINQLSDLGAYLSLLRESPKELQTFSKELLIGVTRFFRDDDAFKKLTESIIPEVVERAKHSKDVRIWVAGCSSGEEAYSLAILADETLRQKKLDLCIKVFATDVDEDAIAEASSGIFSADIAHDVPKERLLKYFEKDENEYRVSPALRKMVIFATHNMIEDPPFSNIDLVSCRNVLIYFQHAAQKRVLSSLYFALKHRGYLFLGSSESLGDLKSHFETADERCRIYRKVSNARVPIGNAPPSKVKLSGDDHTLSLPPTVTTFRSRKASKGTSSAVLERMMDTYAPDSIVLNESLDAIHVYGDVSEYTKGIVAGKISNNIRDMIIDDLNVAVTTALYRCQKNEADVFYKDVALRTKEGDSILIDISIFFIREGETAIAPYHLVLQFINQKSRDGGISSNEKISFNVDEQSRQRIADLEQELVKKQEHLHITVEELETTNEELQSTNEELMSSNEELQSTNEELQSVNEELYTVNSEFQEKISEITETNHDLDSVISSVDSGIVFLDNKLCIRKFTPLAVKYINLRKSDIDRPFHHISHEMVYDDLLNDITKASNSRKIIQKEILSQKDHVLLLKILPYGDADNDEACGVILTITDISRLKFVENALDIAQEKLRGSLLNRSERLIKRLRSSDDVRLLLLDDDAIDRKNVKRLLSGIANRKFKISSYAEIDEAVDEAQSNEYDICLIDYRLSGGTAKDFITKIRAADVITPVIVLSGYSGIGVDTDFLDEDVLDFLNKDELSSQLLSRSIDYVLEKAEMQSALDEFGKV